MEVWNLAVLVSINCTTYNHEMYIADAIESFLMQKTNFDYEILIGEDCSTDNTKKIVEALAKKHPNKIRVITSSKNVGARKNSMRLLENSRGKYIAECEGDDYWTDPYKLQKQMDYMVSHPNCSMSFHASEIIKAPNHATGMVVKPYKQSKKSTVEDIIIGGGGVLCHRIYGLFKKAYGESSSILYRCPCRRLSNANDTGKSGLRLLYG